VSLPSRSDAPCPTARLAGLLHAAVALAWARPSPWPASCPGAVTASGQVVALTPGPTADLTAVDG
jgi:hypothetical protein